MTEEQLKKDVLEYIVSRKNVSFAELSRKFKIKGELTIELGTSNILIWANVSEEFYQVFKELDQENKIQMKPCSGVVYLVDGEALTLPQVVKPPKNGYKKMHWLPVILNPVCGELPK